MTGEVITLQLGGSANFTGTHFWNIQDEYLVNVNPENGIPVKYSMLYRQGETRQGVPTYTPRLLVFDLKGARGALSLDGSLYGQRGDHKHGQEREQIQKKWKKDVAFHQEDLIPKHPYLAQLEGELANTQEQPQQQYDSPEEQGVGEGSGGHETHETQNLEVAPQEKHLGAPVRFWSDYLKVHFHPRTMQELRHVSDDHAFDQYWHGRTLLPEEREEYHEGLRWYAEECDELQGFQLSVDVCSGFGGLAEVMLHEIQDQFPKRSVWTSGLSSFQEQPRRPSHLVNTVFSLTSLAELSTVYTPLSAQHLSDVSFSHISFEPSSQFQTGAIFASFLETASLPYRVQHGQESMKSVISALALQPSMNITAASVALPLPLPSELDAAALSYGNGPPLSLPEGLLHSLWGNSASRLYTASFMTDISLHWGAQGRSVREPFSESVTLRGVPHFNSSTAEALDYYLMRYKSMKRGSYCLQTPQPIPVPFPRFFTGVQKDGSIPVHMDNEHVPSQSCTDVASLPTLSHLQCSSSLHPSLNALADGFSDSNIKRFVCAPGSDVQIDEFEEVKERMYCISDDFDPSTGDNLL